MTRRDHHQGRGRRSGSSSAPTTSPALSPSSIARRPGSHLKENYSLIGPGVTSSADQVINLREPHGFNIGAAAMPNGITNNLHIHFTAEVFLVLQGRVEVPLGPERRRRRDRRKGRRHRIGADLDLPRLHQCRSRRRLALHRARRRRYRRHHLASRRSSAAPRSTGCICRRTTCSSTPTRACRSPTTAT